MNSNKQKEPPNSSAHSRLQRLRTLSRLLDSASPLPGGNRIGLDGIIGLIPGFGDIAGSIASSYIIIEAAPNEKVIEFSNQLVIPLRVPSDDPLAAYFKIQWTPSIIILDQDGNEQYRKVGFYSAKELIPSILMGIGIGHAGKKEFKEAIGCFEEILADYPLGHAAPEAVFHRGVNLYKSTHDPKPLKEVYTLLQEKYPASEWAERAYPYSLLP